MNKLFTIDCGEILLREFRIEDADAIYEPNLLLNLKCMNFYLIGVQQESND